METSHHTTASRYFDYLAGRFPVMCASDEFHFLPRAQAASRYYDRLDDFDASRIEGCLDRLKEFKDEFEVLAGCAKDLETRIDIELLKSSVSAILIEFEMNGSWRCNPLLYLKVAFIGVDHALTKPAENDRVRCERAASRANAVPRLLQQGMENLGGIPQSYLRAARLMAADCRAYLIEIEKAEIERAEIEKGFSGSGAKGLLRGLERSRRALASFDMFLNERVPCRVPCSDYGSRVGVLEANLRDYFLCSRNLDDIFAIAADEWEQNIRRLNELQSEIDRRKSWQDLYHGFFPPEIENMDMASLYRGEIERLREFFKDRGFDQNALNSPLVFAETPTYLRSVRGTASFGAAFSSDPGEKSIFFLTSRMSGQGDKQTAERINRRLHREYKFLTAHEAVPGHHLLDSIRRRLANPVRRQIESPLFYEGWASYAESLLIDYGYVQAPLEYLVDCRIQGVKGSRIQVKK